MYTVASKNSLAKRESRWIRDDETIKHIETPDKTHKCKDNLISDDDILLSNDNNLPILPAMLSSSNNNDILNNLNSIFKKKELIIFNNKASKFKGFMI